MAREEGYLYVLAIGEHAEIVSSDLKDPFCTGFETSRDGELSWMRIPVHLRSLTVPSGLALRVPAALGARLVMGPRFRSLTAEEFYSKGYDPPDAYALQERVTELVAELQIYHDKYGDIGPKAEGPSSKPRTKKVESKKTSNP